MISILLLFFTLGFMLPKRVQTAGKYTIYVNRKTNLVNVVDQSTNKVVRSMYCSTGKNNCTIKGTFKTKVKYRWRALEGNVYGQYATRISGSYLFHSVPYYKKNVKTVETNEYNKLGSQASLGCVRLTVVDAKWIYDKCRIGTKVVINDTKELEKPAYPPIIISTKSRSGWDPTDPDKRNPYHPRITAKSGQTKVICGSTFDPLTSITVTSSVTSQDKLKNHITVKGYINTCRPGRYALTYTVTDPRTELKKTKKIAFTVIARKK